MSVSYFYLQVYDTKPQDIPKEILQKYYHAPMKDLKELHSSPKKTRVSIKGQVQKVYVIHISWGFYTMFK